jgi:hypothetical protein
LEIEILRRLCADETVVVTDHVFSRCRQRKITIDQLFQAIRTGEIIEDYPDDFPYPSCLILGTVADKRKLHVVCGSEGSRLWIVTAYWPDPEKWEADYKTRKEVSP